MGMDEISVAATSFPTELLPAVWHLPMTLEFTYAIVRKTTENI